MQELQNCPIPIVMSDWQVMLHDSCMQVCQAGLQNLWDFLHTLVFLLHLTCEGSVSQLELFKLNTFSNIDIFSGIDPPLPLSSCQLWHQICSTGGVGGDRFRIPYMAKSLFQLETPPIWDLECISEVELIDLKCQQMSDCRRSNYIWQTFNRKQIGKKCIIT